MYKNYLIMALYVIVIENIVFIKFLGVCPLLNATDNAQKSISISLAVTATMTVSSLLSWTINKLILSQFGLEYLQTLVFVLVTAAVVQVVEFFMKKFFPEIQKEIGIQIPLIASNCAILGCVIIGIQNYTSVIDVTIFGFFSGISFMLALMIMSLVRKKIDDSDNIPEAFKGTPILLIAASLISMVLNGFSVLNF